LFEDLCIGRIVSKIQFRTNQKHFSSRTMMCHFRQPLRHSKKNFLLSQYHNITLSLYHEVFLLKVVKI
jgi:hypothetical protein